MGQSFTPELIRLLKQASSRLEAPSPTRSSRHNAVHSIADGTRHACDAVLIAAGAWSAQLAARLGTTLPGLSPAKMGCGCAWIENGYKGIDLSIAFRELRRRQQITLTTFCEVCGVAS